MERTASMFYIGSLEMEKERLPGGSFSFGKESGKGETWRKQFTVNETLP